MNNLKKLRSCLGLTQVEMAEALGLKERQYRNIETGEREPNPDTVRLLEFIDATNIVSMVFKKSPTGHIDGDPSAECRYCYEFLGVGSRVFFWITKDERRPFCSLPCVLRFDEWRRSLV